MKRMRMLMILLFVVGSLLMSSVPTFAYLYGIDISAYQGTPNWDIVKVSTDFVIMRASIGLNTDAQLNRNRSEARRVGMKRGYYHFAYPQYNTAIAEADCFVNAVGMPQPGEKMVLDYEQSLGNQVNWCGDFCDRVYYWTGVKPLIYLNTSTVNAYDWSRLRNSGYGLWLANWDGNNNPNTPSTQWGFNTMKQYSATGSCGGISGPVDLDTFNGDSSAWGVGINPPYLFDGGNDYWYAVNGCTVLGWSSCCGLGGVIYTDQQANDAYIYSPGTSFTGAYAPQCVNVAVYPSGGTTSNHDMQVFWKTNAENYWSSGKSSPVVNYTANEAYAFINLDVDSNKWWNQTINQLRLDFDNTNHGTRFHVNHVVKQSNIWHSFSTGVEGWTSIHALTVPVWTNCCGWPGIMYVDQNGDDAYMHGPLIPHGGENPFYFIGGGNDKIRVQVYPQNGTTASHDMRVYWRNNDDGTWTDSKSVLVNYTGQNQWCTVDVPVGTNANWKGKKITQLRLDFDQVNHSTRFIVDYIRGVF